MTHAETILSKFDALDKALQAKGFPPTSPWWHETLTTFYQSGKRQLVDRVGRRGGKSSTLCRLAVVEGLFGNHRVPPGDIGTVPIISTRKDEAANRLHNIEAILTALNVKYTSRGDVVEAKSIATRRPVRWKVFTATVSGVVGFTGIFAFCDEVAHWRDNDTGANPATQVLSSLRPTLATQPEARIILSSAPYSILDAHYDAFEDGDTPYQMVAYAPTWLANPTISEEDTHRLAPRLDEWRRDFLAIPMAEVESSLLTSDEVAAVTRKAPEVLPYERGHTYMAAMDPAWKADAWTLAVATNRYQNGRFVKVIVSTRQWQGSRANPLSPDAVLKEIAQHLAKYKLASVWTDQAADIALRDIAIRHGLGVIITPSTAASNLERFEILRTTIRDGLLEIPASSDVHVDLLNVRKRITRNGVAIELPRINGRHCDYAPPIALLASKRIPEPEKFGPDPGTPEYEEFIQTKIEAQMQKRWEDQKREEDMLSRYG